jgi:hypothetical protein
MFSRPAGVCPDITVPASVSLPNGISVRGFNADQFRAFVHGRAVPMKSFAVDSTPKRILLLVDLGKQMDEDAWKKVGSVANNILEHARTGDSFALATFDGPDIRTEFSDSREALQKKLSEMVAAPPKAALKNGHLYDALVTAATLFGKPRFGDSIFVLAADTGLESKAVPYQAEEALQNRGIRFFVLYLGALLIRGTSYARLALAEPGLPSGGPPTVVDVPLSELFVGVPSGVLEGTPGLKDLYGVAIHTGGTPFSGFVPRRGDPKVVAAQNVEMSVKLGWAMYGQIAEPYRVDLKMEQAFKREGFELKLDPEMKRKYPSLHIDSPNKIAPCR